MGSDLSYADLTKFNPKDYDYNLTQEGEVRGHKVWIIEAVPRTQKTINETGYEKSVITSYSIHYTKLYEMSTLSHISKRTSKL